MNVFPIIVKENFSRPYFQRGRYHFLIHKLDGSVSGKKAGFYLPPVIFFDELRFYIKEKNKEYDLHSYIKKVKIDISEVTYYFEFKDKKIELVYFVPEDFIGLEMFIKSNKPINLLLAPKFSFNYVWHENPVKKSNIFEKEGCIYANSSFDTKICSMFKANKKLKLINKKIAIQGRDLRIRFTGSVKSERDLIRNMGLLDEKQKKSKMDLKTLFSNNQRAKKKEKYENRILDCVEFSCNDEELNKAFVLAKYNLRALRHHQPGLGRGYLAGIPGYPEFFGRDSFWSIPGILAIGDFDCAKSILNIFARHQSMHKTETKRVGEVPHEIWLTGEPNYYSIDSSLLFIYAIYHYYLWTRDLEYVKDIFDIIKRAVECNISSAKNYLIQHGREGFLKGTTWMDSYKRGATGVDVQALFAKSLEYGAELAKLNGEKDLAKKWLAQSRKAKEKLNLFWKDGWFVDHIHKDKTSSKSLTANPFVLLLLELADKKKAKLCFKKAEDIGLISDFGVRSRAKSSRGYNPASYHKGSIWPLLNGWAILSFFRYGENELAYKMLKKQLKLYSISVPGFAPECLHAEKFMADYSIDGVEEHRPGWNQLWSSSLFLQAVIEELCGIKPNGNKLIIKPKLPKGINRAEIKNLKVFGNTVDIKIQRKKGRIVVKSKIRKK